MKIIILFLASFSIQSVMADTKIHPISHNENYLFVNIDTLPVVDINISFNKGSINDGEYPGLTNLMLNSLMASNYNNNKIISYFENVGAKLSYSVDKESLSIIIRSLSDLDQLIYLTSIVNKALFSNKLDNNILNLEKEKIKRSLDDSKKSPGSILEASISENLFSGTGLSHQILGNKDSIKKISNNMILDHRNKIFNLNNIEINIVGDIDIKGAKRIISSISSRMPISKTSEQHTYTMMNTNYHVEFDSEQSHLSIVIPSITRDHPDYHSLYVANYIFGGGGFGSWLMKEIREKRGLSYSVYSFLGSYTDQGYMRISLQTKNSNLDLTKEIIMRQIKRLKDFDVTDNKIETVKKSILKNFEMRVDTNRKLLNLISAVNRLNLPLNYFDDYKEKIKNVNKESIRKALDASIDFDKISVVSVGKSIE